MGNRKYGIKKGPSKNYNPNSLKNLRPRKKGDPVHPKSCAVKGRHVRPWLIVLMDEFRRGQISQEHVAKRLIYMAAKGDIRAIQIVFDRMDGNTPQPVTLEAGKSFIDLVQEGRRRLIAEGKEQPAIEIKAEVEQDESE